MSSPRFRNLRDRAHQDLISEILVTCGGAKHRVSVTRDMKLVLHDHPDYKQWDVMLTLQGTEEERKHYLLNVVPRCVRILYLTRSKIPRDVLRRVRIEAQDDYRNSVYRLKKQERDGTSSFDTYNWKLHQKQRITFAERKLRAMVDLTMPTTVTGLRTDYLGYSWVLDPNIRGHHFEYVGSSFHGNSTFHFSLEWFSNLAAKNIPFDLENGTFVTSDILGISQANVWLAGYRVNFGYKTPAYTELLVPIDDILSKAALKQSKIRKQLLKKG